MNDDVLGGYLQNHWAAATAGVALFRRVGRTHSDAAIADEVSAMAGEIAEDRESLRSIMESVGVRPSTIGAYGARLAQEVGRLKPNGRLVRRSPLTDVLEPEALRAAVGAKSSGWQLLRAVAESDQRLDADLLDELLRRAGDQLSRLEDVHLRAGRARLR